MNRVMPAPAAAGGLAAGPALGGAGWIRVYPDASVQGRVGGRQQPWTSSSCGITPPLLETSRSCVPDPGIPRGGLLAGFVVGTR